MDIRYKSFVPRSKQDHRFDQLLHTTTSSVNSKPNYNNGSSTSSELSNINSNFSNQRSPINNRLLLSSQSRKKVNVVTFKPDEHNEMITKSTNHNQNQSPTMDQSLIITTNYDISKLNNSNIPSILRTSRLPSGTGTTSNNSNNPLESTSSNGANLVDSASKLIAAKRKAARESNIDNHNKISIITNLDDTKKKFIPNSSSYIPDSSVKRAVSPEILRPDPPLKALYPLYTEGTQHQSSINKSDYLFNSRKLSTGPSTNQVLPLDSSSSNDSGIKSSPINSIDSGTTINNSKTDDNTFISLKSSLSSSQEFNISNNKHNAVTSKPPIINAKKNKVLYNARPWQNQLDDEFENQYKLKPENIIYQSNEPLEVAPDLDCFDYEYEDGDFSNLNDGIDHTLGKSKKNEETSYLNYGLYNTVKQYPTSTTNDTSSLKKIDKEKFTVLKNVKEAHECQETGETQDLLDDVEYLIEGLKSNLQSSTRTLSIITLTSKCFSRSFKELLKAHGLLGKIFKYLEDAHKDESVAMCTAALFLVFARDKQPRLFDDESLELLLKLPKIGKNQTKPSKENERVRDKIRLMLDKLHHSNNDILKTRENEAKPQMVTSSSIVFQRSCVCCRHLKLNSNITTEDLVVESLLQLSSRKCVDWFKNQMRKLRGLDLVCEQVTMSVEYLGEDLGPQNLDEFVMDRLYRLFNYMRFLEHMTFQNRDNQSYLVDYNDTVLINHFLRCLKLCAANLSYQLKGSQEKILIQACLLAILRLLANISHDNEWTSNQMGSCSGLLKLIFSCLLHLPRFMSSGKRFDLSVLALALLINLAEHCSENRLRMAHVAISRKRVACLGKCGQISEDYNHVVNNPNKKSMGFSFDDEVDEEDMDLDEDEYNEESDQILNIDCESSDIKINVLEALVKLFLRHDDRAKNNVLIEGEAEPAVENNEDIDDPDNDPKWRLVADKSLMKKNKSNKNHKEKNVYSMEFSESEDDASSDEGADVEFLINSKEEEEELQRKLSAAGQHMQDSVVSAYTALLLGCIIKGSSRFMERIREHLPSGKFRLLAFVLAKFLSILSLTSGMGKSGEESILEIVRLLEAQDLINTNNNERKSLGSVDNDNLLTSKPMYRNHRHSSGSPTSSSVAYSSKFNLSNTTDEDHNEDSLNDLVSIK